MTEATQPADLPAGEGVEAPDETTPGSLPRDKFLNQLAARQAEQHKTVTEEMERNYAGKEPEVAPEPQAEETAPEPVSWEDEEVELKVDGETRKVKKRDVVQAGVRSLQKETAADRRLEEASKLLREAQEAARRAQIAGNNAAAQPGNPQAQEVAANEAQRAQKYAELVNKLRYAGDDEAVAATRELEGFIAEQAATRAQQATLEALTRQIPDAVRSQVEFQNTSKWFLEEYNDIAGDAYLAPMAAMMEAAARQNGDTRPHRELWTDIGNRLRQRFGGKQVVSLEEKAAKKAAVPDQPKAVSAKAPAAPPEKTPEQARVDYFRQRRARLGEG